MLRIVPVGPVGHLGSVDPFGPVGPAGLVGPFAAFYVVFCILSQLFLFFTGILFVRRIGPVVCYFSFGRIVVCKWLQRRFQGLC